MPLRHWPDMTTRQRWTLICTVIGSGAVFLDGTIVNAALKHIGQELPGDAHRRPRGPGLHRRRLPGGPRRAAHPGRRPVRPLRPAPGLRDRPDRVRGDLRPVRPGADPRVAGRLPPRPGCRRRPAHPGLAGAHHPRLRRTGARPGVRHLGGVDLGADHRSARSSAAALVDTLGWRVAFLINVPLLGFALWATLTPRPGVARHRDDRAVRLARRDRRGARRRRPGVRRHPRPGQRVGGPGGLDLDRDRRRGARRLPDPDGPPTEPARPARALPVAGVRDDQPR